MLKAPAEFVAAKILEDLQRINTSKNSILILVYLPLSGDYQPDDKTDLWREYVRLASERTGTLFIDLVDEFRKLPSDEVQGMFLSDDDIDYPGAAGHYTVKGNEFVAEVLYNKLVSFPGVSAKFDELK